MRTLAPRNAAAQHVVDSLETLAATNTAARAVPRWEEIARLLDETAANFGDLFNSESDPGEVNGFLRSIKMQAVVDTVARTASVTADLTPLLVRESHGVSVRVRGGT